MDEISTIVYAWEKGTTRLWESVEEDQEGNLMTAYSNSTYVQKRQTYQFRHIRRGLIRYLILAIDCSLSSMDRDFRPNRLEASKMIISQFITDYFDQNPISQLGLVVTRDRLAEKVTNLSTNIKNHINKLKDILRVDGLASLQNIIKLSMITLQHVPDYGSKEILIIYSSLSTCDPEDIFITIQEAKLLNIKISIICLAAEVYICKRITELTGGKFAVAKDNIHLNELVNEHTIPLPYHHHSTTTTTEQKGVEIHENQAEFLYVGFPKQYHDANYLYSFDGTLPTLSTNGYMCPRCLTRTTQLPAQCNVCNLQLNSSAHIARSYHHLFPVPYFNENTNSSTTTMTSFSNCCCYGCMSGFEVNGMQLQCPDCQQIFCGECDIFIHESLHNCPGCCV